MLQTIGCDPEVFLVDKDTKEWIDPSNITQGNKLFNDPEGLLVDGLALEFTTIPASTKEEFINIINKSLSIINNKVGVDNISLSSIIKLDKEKFEYIPPSQKIFGCDPEYNIYTGKESVIPPEYIDEPMRCAGGHVHIGLEKQYINKDTICNFTALLDRTLGLISQDWDKDLERKKMYGKYGSIRFKSYGFEYRVLSNQWIFNNKLISRVYDIIKSSADLFKTSTDKVENIILNNNITELMHKSENKLLTNMELVFIKELYKEQGLIV